MLVWREAMSTGHPDIDKAQKQFIAHINEFETSLRGAGADTAIGLFLTGLYDQAAINFSREEKIQRESSFPFLDVHHREHALLLERLANLMNQYQSLPHQADHGQLLRDLAGLIKDWVSHHMVQSDVKLRQYVPRQPPQSHVRPRP
jgi:hemerythrin